MGINRGRRPFEWKIFLPFVAEEGLHVNQQQHLCYYILTWKCLLFQLIHETSNQENLSVPLKMDQSSPFLKRQLKRTISLHFIKHRMFYTLRIAYPLIFQ